MPEKTVTDMPLDLRRIFIKGNEALQRDNFDYAIELFHQVLEKEPGFFECRKALRTAQSKKSGGSSTGFFRKMMSNAGSSPQIAKAKMSLQKNPAEALAIAEQILNGDPNNSFAHKIAAEAAQALEMPRTAALSLEVLSRNSPHDKALAIEFGVALADAGEIARAEKVLIEFARTMPNDPEVAQALKNLSARNTMDEGGYDALAGGTGSYRDILKDKDQAVSLEQEKRVQKTEDMAERLIGEYEAKLKTEPNNLKTLRNLAELYTQKKQFDRAISYYERIKASEAGAGDSALDRAIAETKVRQFDYQIEQLNPFAADNAEQIAKIKADKLTFQVAECQERVEKFPTDLMIRFEMGQLYFQAGKIGEAIQELQKAQGNPHKRLAAMNLLAQCFAKRKMYDLAAKTLQNAIKEKVGFDDEKKDLIYNLGCVLESMDKKEEAIEQFKLIYETDIGYKDVAAKVDAFYAGQ
jgi:tetratricopeptide (TPR) repeat protein